VRTPSALAIRWCGGPPRADSGGAQRRRTPRQRGRRPQDQWHCAERHRVQGRRTTLVERVLHDQKCTCALFRCVSDDSDRCGGASRQSVCDRTPRQRRRILWDLVTDTMRWWLTMRAGVECRRLSRMRHSEFACSRILEIYCFPEYWFLAQSRLSGQPSSKPV